MFLLSEIQQNEDSIAQIKSTFQSFENVAGHEKLKTNRTELSEVLRKHLNTETSQHGNALKTAFEEFPFYFGKPLKTGKR